MPPWRASRGLVLGLLTCLSVTLVLAESVTTPTQRDEAFDQKSGTTAASAEAMTPPSVSTLKRAMTVTSQKAVMSKEALVEEPGLKEASVEEPGLKEASMEEPGLKEASVEKPGLKEASMEEPGLKEASPEKQDMPRMEAQSSGSENQGTTTAEIEGPPKKTGLIVVLLLILLALLVTLTGAWCKLREYGGTGAYYPWQMETGVRGTRRWVRTLRSMLPGRTSSQREDLEAEDLQIVDEENEGEDEEDEEEPRSEEEEPRSDEEEEEEGGSKLRGEGDSLSDYSSLGGIDLRERAGEAAEGDDGSFPPPPSSPRGSEVLDGLHSLAGSAPWGEAGQDVTAL